MAEGGEREDDGPLGGLLGGRFLRHFHDPLRPWSQAGLDLGVLGRFDSSVYWMQRADQDAQAAGTGTWSWAAARQRFREGLTAPSPAARQQSLARLFRGLGQLMHLVADASVPEHARNTPHPALGPVFGTYEYWVQQQHGTAAFQGYLASPVDADGVWRIAQF